MSPSRRTRKDAARGEAGAGEALRRLRRLRGVTWAWRDEAPGEAKQQPGMGVIAQEVEAVFPELIEQTLEGNLRVEYDGLVPPLMAAVKELDQRLLAIENTSEERSAVSDADERLGRPQSEATERVSRAAGEKLRTELDPDEIEKTFPELVIMNEEGERVVAYEGLVGLLIEAVKELDARVSELERRLGGSGEPAAER